MLIETSSNISTYLQENAVDVLIIIGAFIILVCSLCGYIIYIRYMSKDEKNKDRLLNILYGNLSICNICNSALFFLLFLLLKLFGIKTFAFCLLARCRRFTVSFTLLMFLQISLVTSISHYNPTYYLELSLKWRRFPFLFIQVFYLTCGNSVILMPGVVHIWKICAKHLKYISQLPVADLEEVVGEKIEDE